MRKADIYIIGRDNTQWLQALYANAWPFEMLVVDESSSFKNHQSKRFKALKMIRPLIKRVVLLSGTPAPNGLLDLWSQLYLLDRGKRLGDNITGYRERFFIRKESGFGYRLRPDGEAMIHDRIKDIAISMKSEDYLTLPERVDNFIKIILPPDKLKQYNDFERDAVIELKKDLEITAVNAGALTTKLTQFANGAMYDANKIYHTLHDEKLDALEEIIDSSAGQPV
jgi:SNF2 family DNA or RNA helicase